MGFAGILAGEARAGAAIRISATAKDAKPYLASDKVSARTLSPLQRICRDDITVNSAGRELYFDCAGEYQRVSEASKSMTQKHREFSSGGRLFLV
jgi:hypothetical protein